VAKPPSQRSPAPNCDDPSTGTWSTTGSLAVARDAHTATVLPNGKVLVAGGNSNGTYLASAELYDPATGIWSATGTMATPRYLHVATILPSGKVLVAGGSNSSSYLASAEVYDPVSGTWSTTGTMAYHHGGGHIVTVLINGKVLVAGGSSNDLPSAFGISRAAELFDPATGTWASTGSMATPRYAHTATRPARSLWQVAPTTAVLWSALYNSNNGTWSAAASLAVARDAHTATLLAEGNVLVAGGYNTSGSLASNEVYDVSAGTWSGTGVLATARGGQTATLLTTGKVVVAGGVNSSNNSLASSELYDPSPAPAPLPPPGGTNLFGVLVNGGASGQVEVHALSQQSHYSQFITHAASGFGATNNADWQFLVAPSNGDGQPDLYGQPEQRIPGLHDPLRDAPGPNHRHPVGVRHRRPRRRSCARRLRPADERWGQRQDRGPRALGCGQLHQLERARSVRPWANRSHPLAVLYSLTGA
jgi:hypothetical protein